MNDNNEETTDEATERVTARRPHVSATPALAAMTPRLAAAPAKKRKKMAVSTKIIVAFFVAYVGFLMNVLHSQLFPKYFIQFMDPETKKPFPNFEPAWKENVTMALRVEIVVGFPGKSPLATYLVRNATSSLADGIRFTETMDWSMRVNLSSLAGFAEHLARNASCTARYTLYPPNSAATPPLILEVPIVVFLPPTRAGRKAQTRVRRKLVKGWPILGSLYPDPPEPQPPALPATRTNTTIGYLSPKVAGYLVADWTSWPHYDKSRGERENTPVLVLKSLRLVKQGLAYMPITSTHQMGRKTKDLIQINATREANGELLEGGELEIRLASMGLGRFMFYGAMENALELNRKMGVPEKDIDDVRYLLTETLPEVLLLTVVVALVHVMFDVLAFKSDIGFWRAVRSARGVSLRSLVLSLVSQVVVLAYLLDNDTTTLVLAPALMGVVVQAWKVLKTSRLMASGGGRSEIDDVGREESHTTRDTADREALFYMSLVLVPLVVGYSFLSLVRDTHYGWWSWTVSSLARCVYAGGFALMTPQIYLNYKLKSVTALDWGSLWYRAFNTFIDDFFAFLLPMPSMHRAAVFRDDVVFLIFLYQRWIYPAREEEEEEEEKTKLKTE